MNIHAPSTTRVGESGDLVLSDVNFKTVQTIVARLPRKNNNRYLIKAVRFVSKTIDTVSDGATVTVKEVSQELPIAATLTTALSGSNNDLVFTGVPMGSYGNAVTVAYVNPATPSAALSASISGQAITVNLATGPGTRQVETATVVAAAGATSAGNLPVTVTGAGITGSPLTTNVALLGDSTDDTAAKVAAKIATVLNAVTAITALYAVTSNGADVIFTRNAANAAANDATLNIAWTNVLGITAVTTSTNTTAGVVPAITSTAAQVKAAVEALTGASALVTIANASANDGTGVVTALSPTNLSGGADYTVGSDIVASVALLDADKVGLVQTATLASGIEVVEGGRGVEFAITNGATATTDIKDVVVEYLVL